MRMEGAMSDARKQGRRAPGAGRGEEDSPPRPSEGVWPF